jgi:hypothetical protein
MVTLVDANSTAYTCQGTDAATHASARAGARGGAWRVAVFGMKSGMLRDWTEERERGPMGKEAKG